MEEPLVLGRALFDLGAAWDWAGDGARAAAFYGEAVPVLRRAGAPTWLALALVNTAYTQHWLGTDLERATELADEGLALYREEGDTWGVGLATGIRAHIALSQGDLALARRLFIASIAAADEAGDQRAVMGAVVGLAGVAAASGQSERAVRLLGAMAAAQDALGVARIMHHLHADRILAATRGRLGEPQFAAAWEEGRAVPFANAVTDARAIAAAVPSELATAETGRDPGGLTPRERDVLQLLVEGRTDREIAAALFIGPRTVQTHVSNLLAKLKVSNRAEAAVMAVRTGLV
jgi:non-specific serine/threonine protein kinase